MADGLHVQRVHLHLREWRQLVEDDTPLPDVGDGVGARQFAGMPFPVSTDPAGRPTSGGSYGDAEAPWVSTALALQIPDTGGDLIQNPLSESANACAARLVETSTDAWAGRVRTACATAAWWVGFFTVIRHRGVHHVTLDQDKPAVTLPVVQEAADVVALGLGLRALEAHLRHIRVTDTDAMDAYCRAITSTIAVESRLPRLLGDLAELRLVDLVTLAVPWRGRFTKYAGGTGAGQVE
ncbi:MAG: hypothetical protein ACRCYX_11950 [Dermatophilaceae bacterium]